jgi:valyl-tRNA synthetase
MDEHYVRCVQNIFVELYQKGLIYRGKRMVNWCPASLTALSDEEVDMEMEPQKGFLWYFQVEVAEEPGTFLTIATTRPETIPGDTAVAVNSKDQRYSRLIGKHALRPLPAEYDREKKLIPIIADDHIDPQFGTGVLKVTPAHDKADFEIGQRHSLPAVDIMHPNGTMNELAGADLDGLDRFEARKVAVEKLKVLGALVKEEPYENKVGFSQRAKVPIEPRLSEQWFLKYPSVEQAKACVDQEGSTSYQPLTDGNLPSESAGRSPALPGQWPALSKKMHFHPDRWAKVYDHWMSNIQDWCISRQLWWGHRVPVWRKEYQGDLREIYTALATILQADVFPDRKPSDNEIVVSIAGRRVPSTASAIRRLAGSKSKDLDEVATRTVAIATTLNNLHLERHGFVQDPDVLDTWFSSWLWPFATMNWTGDKTQDAKNPTLRAFYPTTDLVTGPDIIFFWVARMIMAGYEFMGEMPFKNVYFTGIIRDKQGRKMSKTLGNSPDPLELIAKYGADALRFGTMRSAPLGQDVLFDEKDVELGRNFCNKLWNACRFRQRQGGRVQDEIDPNRLRSDDKWILLRLHQAIKEISSALAEYKFNEATATLYRFFWSEYCDWYVEASKPVLARQAESLAPENIDADSTSAKERSRAGEVQTEGSASASQQVNPPIDEARRANTLAVIDFVLSHTLRLFHPFLPFITEELWQEMGYAEDMPAEQGGRSIMHAPWPKPFDADLRDHYSLDNCYLEYVDAKYELITLGRNLRREANIPANKKVAFYCKPSDRLAATDADIFKFLLNAETFEIDANYQPSKGTPSVRGKLGDLYLPLEGLIDVAAERARLMKEADKIQGEIDKVMQKLNNPAFVQKVPPQVLLEHQQRLADWKSKLEHAQTALENLPST